MALILLNKRTAIVAFLTLLFAKSLIYVSIKISGISLFGGGNDSDYYHSYAIGKSDYAVNLWARVLRLLNDLNLYDRSFVSILLFLTAALLIPLLFAHLSSRGVSKLPPFKQKAIFWNVLVAISLYPTLFFYTTDIYREIFMVTACLVTLIFIMRYINGSAIVKIVSLPLILFSIWILFLLRPYLGMSLAVSVILYPVFRFKGALGLVTILIYTLVLVSAFKIGLLDDLLRYRKSAGFLTGGSSFGLDMLGVTPTTFVKLFSYSLGMQLFGFVFRNGVSILVFLLESIPFIMATLYFLKNVKFANPFVRFLALFFVVYTTVWVLGNDNLGTGVRLRIFSYLALVLASVLIYTRKFTSEFMKNGANS